MAPLHFDVRDVFSSPSPSSTSSSVGSVEGIGTASDLSASPMRRRLASTLPLGGSAIDFVILVG